MIGRFLLLLTGLSATVGFCGLSKAQEPGTTATVDSGALAGCRYRVLVSTDIGGTDPDDFQSMVHLLVYADCFDIEGLISSPYGPGRKEHILEVIDCYEKDYANLKTYSDRYPTPDALRAITKQGETERAPYAGVRRSTEGSQWIVECARRNDPQPLHVLVWGGIEDLVQALHDAPDILPKLRVYWIGGPNKKWGPDAFTYLATHHRDLWIIECNATYRGWFTGGDQSGQWGNEAFVSQHIAGKGALGDFFVSKKADIKMGDTPSVGWLLKGTPDDPSRPGWGGRFVRAWERPYSRFERMTTKEDRMEVFGVLELVLPIGNDIPKQPEAVLSVENQELPGYAPGDGTMRFRFCPKSAQVHGFRIQSNVPALDGKIGAITVYMPSPDMARHPASDLPNWWTDDPSSDVAEGSHHGAKTVSQWREAFLGDFAQRMLRCQSPASTDHRGQSLQIATKPPAKRLRVVMSTDFPPISASSLAAPLKPRVVVLTDISTWETDDHESLIRLLAHADMFEIEGLVISTGYSIETLTKSPEKDFINIAHGVVDAYEKDLPNLMQRSKQVGHKFDGSKQEIGYWPSPKYLRDRTMFGSLNRGKKYIGDDNDSPGSEVIINLADEEDPRPIWVTVWGGGNTAAQSIYRVKKERTAEQFKAFLCKIRVYTITDQDRHYRGEGLDVSAHGWMREQAGGDLLFIWDESAWKAHNGTGKSNWNQYATHIQGHGHLGSQYPKYKYGVEGDTPSFLYLMPTGLNDPEDPTQCSWGGTFKGDANNLWQSAGSCRSYFDQFYPAAFNNFAARMDWARNGAGNRNPVIVLGGDDGISVLTKTPRQGTAVTLDASKSFDPDGDNLKFNWWIQPDAGTYPGNISISNNRPSVATVNVPSDSAGKSFHVICEVIDDGTHNLSDYRRIIFRPIAKD